MSPEVYWKYGLHIRAFEPSLCACLFYLPERFRFQTSVYVSLLFLFFAYIGLHCSSHKTLTARFSGVFQGPVSVAVFLFPNVTFWHTRAILLPKYVSFYVGVSVIFGD